MGMTDFNPDSFSAKMEEMLAVIRQVNEQFRDPVSIVTMRYQMFSAVYCTISNPHTKYIINRY